MIWLMIVLFFTLIILGTPIAFAMGGAAIAFIVVEGIPLSMVAQRFFSNTQSFAFLAVPFFIFAGNLMVESGIAKRIINFTNTLVRRLPGGLACVSVVTSMLMAGISGSSVADAASVGSILIPEMEENGYSKSFSAAINASSSVVGIIIPPSSTMIIIAWLANLSVARMFLAGTLPGLLIGGSYLVLTIVISLKRGYPRGSFPTVKEILKSAMSAFWALILPIFLIGSIVLGIATPTEAAAISVVYAFVVSIFAYRSLDIEKFKNALISSVKGTTIVMLIVCSSNIFTWVLIREGIPKLIGDALIGLGLPNWMMVFLITLVLFISGTVMDLVPNLFIFIPILFPIATDIGLDPIHFSIIMLTALSLGLFTPPVGSTLFISCHLADITIEDTYKDLIPYFVVGIGAVLVVAYVPWLTLWLPGLFF